MGGSVGGSDVVAADFSGTGGADDGTGGVQLDPSLDRHVELLVAPVRRGVLYALTGTDRKRTVEELARAVARMHPDDPDAESVGVELVHCHLPKLAEAGVVEFDRERGTVEYTGDERVEGLLDCTESQEGTV